MGEFPNIRYPSAFSDLLNQLRCQTIEECKCPFRLASSVNLRIAGLMKKIIFSIIFLSSCLYANMGLARTVFIEKYSDHIYAKEGECA